MVPGSEALTSVLEYDSFFVQSAAEGGSQRTGVVRCIPLMQLALFRVLSTLEHAGLSE